MAYLQRMMRTWMGAAMLAALALAACSSHDEGVENPVDILSRFGSNGKAWLSIDINLPAEPTSRAGGDNDTYVDGEGSEYAVHNAYLFVFKGDAGSNITTESDITFLKAYRIDHNTIGQREQDQVTSQGAIAIDDIGIKTGDKLYAFVILNGNSDAITDFTTPTTVALKGGTATANETTYAQFRNLTIGSVKTAGDGFLMTNATLSPQPGGTSGSAPAGTTTSLVELNTVCFFPTEDEAVQHPAATIYVERAAAKVTVNQNIAAKTIAGNTNIDFAQGDLQFALDNYNSACYVSKHFQDEAWRALTTAPGTSSAHSGDATHYRFIDTYETLTGSGVYRTHWAEDVNYSGKDNLTVETLTSLEGKWTAIDLSGTDTPHPQYCAENTFDLDHQQDDCTTSVLVRLQLNDGTGFYTTSVTGRDIIYQPVKNPDVSEEGTGARESFSPRRSSEVTSAKTIDAYLRQWLMENYGEARAWVAKYAGGKANHIKFTVSTPGEGGTATVTAVGQTAQESAGKTAQGESPTGGSAFSDLDIPAYINKRLTLTYYPHGYCYYRVPIRHFGDELTPWTPATTMTGNTPTTVYGSDNAKYLGRYGVVRNNWYDLTITSVTHVGSAVLPPLTTAADDLTEQSLNAKLTIKGWLKHE